VRSKSNTYYVQTEDEMRAQLLELGLSNSALDAGEGQIVEGETMTSLVRTLASLEESLLALERRGIALKIHAERRDPATGKLPVFHVTVDGREEWFVGREALDTFVAAEEAKSGGKLNVDSGKVAAPVVPTPSTNGDDTAAAEAARLRIVELHEVRTINNLLTDLEKLGFAIEALIPQERTGEETSRYTLRRGENEIGLEDLRGLPGAIRAAGEKGLQITRFKGLGEMNAEELRDTTLDPKARTLMQIRMDDAGAAADLFGVLMGDHVEPRREFIQKHALDVRNLDV
jgi:DNA gyrase subunit B